MKKTINIAVPPPTFVSTSDSNDSSRSRGDSAEFSFSETEEEDNTTPHKPNWVENEILHGFTEKGDTFIVPQTRDTVGMLKRINEIPTLVTW